MALMAAEELGVPYESVRVVVADTEAAAFSNGTGGSRVTFATGMAVIEAARDIVSQLKARAAALWSLDADMVDWQDGQVVPRPGVNVDAKPLSLADLAGMAAKTGGPLLGRASLNARGAGPGFSADEIVPAIERLVEAYLDLRSNADERFIETYNRLGLAPFKAALYPEARANAA